MNKQILIMLAGLILSTGFMKADTSRLKKEFIKEISESFDIDRNGEVITDNRYGDVIVKTWDKAKAQIDVRITVDARNQEDADKVFERIDVNFSNGNDFVKVETVIEAKKKGWSFWVVSSSNDDYRIDIEIYMPPTCDLNLANKYGDIQAESLQGDARVQLKYGNFRFNDVSGKFSAELGYGNGNLLSCNELDVQIKYSNFSVKSAVNARMETKYSRLSIEEVEDLRVMSKYDNYDIWSVQKLRVDGKYDKYNIENTHSFEAYGKYSNYVVEHLTGSADLHMEYGEARLEDIHKDFKEVLVSGKYTTFRFDVAEGSQYSVDLSGKYTGVRYPAEMVIEEEELDDREKVLRGYVGAENVDSRIRARTEYGSFHLK